MGKPTSGNALGRVPEYIGCARQAGELKHLSTQRKGKKPRLPEKWRAKRDQPKLLQHGDGSLSRRRVVGLQWFRLPAGRRVTKLCGRRSAWNCTPQRVT